MVKKIKITAEKAPRKSARSSKVSRQAAGLMDSQLALSVKESAQQIWLAGMGAFSKAQEEGTKVFEALVKEGMTLQKKTQGLAEDKISEVTGRMSAMAGSVSSKAGENWDKLEAIFEQRTAKAMNKLGVPTAKDVDALVKRVDQLAAAVARLSRPAAVEPAAPRTRRAAKVAAEATDSGEEAAQTVVEAVKPARRAAVKRAPKAAAPKVVAETAAAAD